MTDVKLTEFLNCFDALSSEQQKAFYGVIKHMDFVDEMVDAGTASKEQLQALLALGRKSGDAYMQVVTTYALIKKYGDI